MTISIWDSVEKVIRSHKLTFWVAKKINHLRINIYTICLHSCRFLSSECRRRGIKDKRFSKIIQFKSIHEGKRCFIVCTGPSLTIDDVEALTHEYSFGMNSICKLYEKTKWRATYYGIIDHSVYSKICHNKEFQNIEHAFVSDTMLRRCAPLTLRDYICFPLDMSEANWHNMTKAQIRFSDNAYAMVYDVATVTYALMQIAIYMGFKEIYLLGCDCDYSGNKQHFEEYRTRIEYNPEEQMLVAYVAAKRYADSHGIKIYNATRGGKLEVFERVDFDSLFSDKDDENKCIES